MAKKLGKCDPAPRELLQRLAAGQCAMFVGAGLSRGAGFPSWADLLLQFVDDCEHKGEVDTAHATELRNLVAKKNAKDLLMVAQELSDRLTEADFKKEIARLFRDKTKKPTATHAELTKKNFTLVVTTNYDKLVENAYAKALGEVPDFLTYRSASAIADALWGQAFFILKAHGSVEDPEHLVITEKDYRSLIRTQLGYRAALSAIFTMKTIAFFGVSLGDPELQLLLSYMHDAFHGGGAEHYALVPRSDFTHTEMSRWKKDYKVTCIGYDPTAGHPEVDAFIKTLPNK